MQSIHLANPEGLHLRKLIPLKTKDYRDFLAFSEDRVYAVDDTCTHEDASFSKGLLLGDYVKCPLHGSRFCLVCGQALDEPAEEAFGTWPITIDDDNILSVYQTNRSPL